MKKNAFYLCMLLSLLLSANNMFAGHRSCQQALRIAQNKAQSLGIEVSTPTTARRISAMAQSNDADAPYYVFNNGESHGWTIVSGDNRMPDVLAYSDEGSLDMDNLPDAVKDIIGSFEKCYNNLDSTPAAAKSVRKVSATGTANHAIGPLCVTTWDQFEPYNNLTPTSDGKHCATCCVATAMAQILYYLYHTQAGQDSTTFTNSIDSRLGEVSVPRTYKWDKMLSSYKGANYTAEQATAIATLMRDCGYALDVIYGVKESTASSDMIRSAGAAYFGLDASSVSYNAYSNVDAFFAAIDAELNTYHPVQVCGNRHSFICDGRDMTGQYYHFNFGYSGGGNGFYCSDAYNGYGTEMYLTTGLRLAKMPTTPESAKEKLQVVYNSAVKAAELRPVGATPGFYQQKHYDTLMSYLASAKDVVNGTTTLSDTEILALVNNIGTAEQEMTTNTTPYPDDWYYINTAATYNGVHYGLGYYTEGSDTYTALYEGLNTVQRFKFVYDETSNGYYISNYGATRYLVGLPGYGKDPVWSTVVADKVPCEVVATDRIGDTDQFMVTIRPMAKGYKDDQDRYLCAWTNDANTSWECGSSDTPLWVYGGDPYSDGSKWTLTSISAQSAVTELSTKRNIDGITYNLAGQHVKSNIKGVILRNGKKYINK